MGYLRKRTIWERLFGRRRPRFDMRDEGDLYARPRLTWRMIVGCLVGAAVLYLLLTAALVLTHG
jgi:hypothetical protein